MMDFPHERTLDSVFLASSKDNGNLGSRPVAELTGKSKGPRVETAQYHPGPNPSDSLQRGW